MRKLIICHYVFYVLIVTYFSLSPMPEKNIIFENLWDKALHFIAYLILVILIINVHVRLGYLKCVLMCFSYSFIIECIQYFTPNRQFDVLDMLANLLGTVLGVIIYYLVIEKSFDKRREASAKVTNK